MAGRFLPSGTAGSGGAHTLDNMADRVCGDYRNAVPDVAANTGSPLFEHAFRDS